VKRAVLAVTLALAAAARPFDPVSIELHHRSAESLLTVLRPLAAPATLTGAGMWLQVRAAPADLARVTQLVRQSDRSLRPLAIALRDDPPPADSDPPARDGSVTLSTGGALPADVHGNGQFLSTLAQRRGTEVLEGDPVRISMPATQSLRFRRRDSGLGVAGAVHFDAVSDFAARIWLVGETVAIELQPRGSGRVAASSEETWETMTVYGQAGRWIALADSGTSPDSAGNAAPRTGVWIKVMARPDPE